MAFYNFTNKHQQNKFHGIEKKTIQQYIYKIDF